MIRRQIIAELLRVSLGFAVASGIMPAGAAAQVYIGRDIPHRGNVEISGGAVWSPGYDLETASADETRNPGTGSGPFVLFAADSRVDPSVGARGMVGVYLAPEVSVEGGLFAARPRVSTRLTGDAESAPDVTATETLTRLIVDGSVLLHLTGVTFGGGNGVPFIFGGGGYLRDAHDKNEVIETGHEFHVGAGLHYWGGEGRHRVGLRFDAGVSWRTGGADGTDTRRTVPTVAGSIAYVF